MSALVNGILDRTRRRHCRRGRGRSQQHDAARRTTQIAGFPAPWTPQAPSRHRPVPPVHRDAGIRGGAEPAAEARPAVLGRRHVERHDALAGQRGIRAQYLPPDPVGYRWTSVGDDRRPRRRTKSSASSANPEERERSQPQPESYQLPRRGADSTVASRLRVARTGRPGRSRRPSALSCASWRRQRRSRP